MYSSDECLDAAARERGSAAVDLWDSSIERDAPCEPYTFI